MKKIVIILYLLYSCVYAGVDYRLTNSSLKSRSLALGSAFLAVKDSWAALQFNPAGFVLDENENLTVHASFNPAGIMGLIGDQRSSSPWTVPVSLLVHGFGISNHRFDLGILMGDESLSALNRLDRSTIWGSPEYAKARNYTLGGRFVLAPRVSLGLAADMYVRNTDTGNYFWGYRYGIRLTPRDNLALGLCYYNLPNDLKNERLMLERISDETLNAGVTYKPVRQIMISADIRNVSDEDKEAAREPHLGVEILPVTYASFRMGYYQVRFTEEKAWSFGLGFKNFKNEQGHIPLLFPVKFSIDIAYIRYQSRIFSDWVALTTQIYFH